MAAVLFSQVTAAPLRSSAGGRHQAQSEAGRVQAETTERAERTLREVAENAGGRQADTARSAATEVERGTAVARELEQVLARVAATGDQLGSQVGEALLTFESALSDAGTTVDNGTAEINSAVSTANQAVEAIGHLERDDVLDPPPRDVGGRTGLRRRCVSTGPALIIGC